MLKNLLTDTQLLRLNKLVKSNTPVRDNVAFNHVDYYNEHLQDIIKELNAIVTVNGDGSDRIDTIKMAGAWKICITTEVWCLYDFTQNTKFITLNKRHPNNEQFYTMVWDLLYGAIGEIANQLKVQYKTLVYKHTGCMLNLPN